MLGNTRPRFCPGASRNPLSPGAIVRVDAACLQHHPWCRVYVSMLYARGDPLVAMATSGHQAATGNARSERVSECE